MAALCREGTADCAIFEQAASFVAAELYFERALEIAPVPPPAMVSRSSLSSPGAPFGAATWSGSNLDRVALRLSSHGLHGKLGHPAARIAGAARRPGLACGQRPFACGLHPLLCLGRAHPAGGRAPGLVMLARTLLVLAAAPKASESERSFAGALPPADALGPGKVMGAGRRQMVAGRSRGQGAEQRGDAGRRMAQLAVQAVACSA